MAMTSPRDSKFRIRFGESDLYITGTSVELSFTLCHESDIHFESQDETLIKRVTEVWTAAGVGFYEVE